MKRHVLTVQPSCHQLPPAIGDPGGVRVVILTVVLAGCTFDETPCREYHYFDGPRVGEPRGVGAGVLLGGGGGDPRYARS